MINIINHLPNDIQYPPRDFRHTLNHDNGDIIKEVKGRLRLLNPDLHTGTVTVSKDRDGTYRMAIESSDASTIERITRLLKPYFDELNPL